MTLELGALSDGGYRALAEEIKRANGHHKVHTTLRTAPAIAVTAEHKIVTQVAGPNSHAIKLLPPFAISDSDCRWIVESVEAVVAAAHHVPGAAWSLGRTFAANFMRR